MPGINSKNATLYTAEEAKNEVLRMVWDFAIWFYTNYMAEQWETPFDQKNAIKEIMKFVSEYKWKLSWDYTFILQIFENFQNALIPVNDSYKAYYYGNTNKLFLDIMNTLTNIKQKESNEDIAKAVQDILWDE